MQSCVHLTADAIVLFLSKCWCSLDAEERRLGFSIASLPRGYYFYAKDSCTSTQSEADFKTAEPIQHPSCDCDHVDCNY